MKLDGAPWMEPSLGFDISLMGLLGGVEVAEVHRFAVNLDGRAPPVAPLNDTKESRRVVGLRASLVLRVDAGAHIAQICEGVVPRVAVNVVDLLRWPRPRNVQPSKSMGEILPIVNLDPRAPSRVHVASNVANGTAPGCPNAPRKDTSVGVVVEQFAQARGGKIVCSHDAVLSQSGQRPQRGSKHAAASPFYGPN